MKANVWAILEKNSILSREKIFIFHFPHNGFVIISGKIFLKLKSLILKIKIYQFFLKMKDFYYWKKVSNRLFFVITVLFLLFMGKYKNIYVFIFAYNHSVLNDTQQVELYLDLTAGKWK